MHWRKGLIGVLTMSLLACVVARAQQPLPWGPGTLPLAPPDKPDFEKALDTAPPPVPMLAQVPLELPLAPPTESITPGPVEPQVPAPAAATALPANPWGTAGCVDPAARFLGENQPQLVDLLHQQALDLMPDGDNRRVIQRVREVVEETQVGVDVSDERWTDDGGPGIQLGGRIHLDWVNWARDSAFGGQPNYVEFRRLRLSASGEGYGVLFYQLEMEFSPEIDLRGEVVDGVVDLGEFGVEMKDAYLGAQDVPFLGTVLVGHFFTPMGLELQTSSNYITFMERGLPRVFLPGREVGVAAHNHTFDERINWAYGIFFDEMNQASHAIVDDNQGIRLVGRVSGTPYYDDLSEGRYFTHLGLGYAYTRPRRRDAPLPPDPLPGEIPIPPVELYRPVAFAARPEIHRGSSLISTGPINTKRYHILNGEFAWVHGPLSIQTELTWTSLDELDGATTDLYGSYIYASYFLTGESRRYDRRVGDFKRTSPYENFWLVRTPRGTSSGWGAWEVACRWSFLDLSDATGLPLYPDAATDEVRSQQLNDLTLGVNWYWNPHARMMFNWIHPFAHESALAERTSAEGDIMAMRLQIEY